MPEQFVASGIRVARKTAQFCCYFGARSSIWLPSQVAERPRSLIVQKLLRGIISCSDIFPHCVQSSQIESSKKLEDTQMSSFIWIKRCYSVIKPPHRHKGVCLSSWHKQKRHHHIRNKWISGAQLLAERHAGKRIQNSTENVFVSLHVKHMTTARIMTDSDVSSENEVQFFGFIFKIHFSIVKFHTESILLKDRDYIRTL